MKKLILFFLLCVLLAGTCCASGGNIDGGNPGDIGLGDGTNFWHGGEDGIRVTVVRSSDYVERVIMDFAEVAHPEVQRHFGKVSKRTT